MENMDQIITRTGPELVYQVDKIHFKVIFLIFLKVYPSYLVWLFPKNSAYSIPISDNLNRLLEAGLVEYHYKLHSEKAKKKSQDGTQVFKSFLL